MAWDTPITIGKTTETQYTLDAKKVYCMAKYNDTYNEMTLTDFADNFEKMLDNVGFGIGEAMFYEMFDEMSAKFSAKWSDLLLPFLLPNGVCCE